MKAAFAVPLAYGVTAALCCLAPYVTAPRFPAVLLSQFGAPLACTSVALGIAALFRKAQGWVELVVSTVWGMGAVALCVHLSAPPLSFERIMLLARVRGFLVAGAVCGLLLTGWFIQRRGTMPLRVLNGIAFLAVTVLLARVALMDLGVLPASGLDGFAEELRAFQRVLYASSLVVLAVAVASRVKPAWA